MYFYHRALERQDEGKDKIKPEDFRYPGPPPQTKEAAIVMLADASEAATKAIAQPTPAKINDVVTKVINNKFIDGQLDQCDLTLRDLHRIAEVFSHLLSGIFHTRVEYPEMEKAAHESNSAEQPATPDTTA
jgi:membrane-associated HD superfamily phosphohydrolase